MIIDFAERAHNHNWDLDPVVRSLLDTDFYKLLMLQFIWKHFSTTQVSFSVTNRSTSLRLADVIAREEVLQQLEAFQRLRATPDDRFDEPPVLTMLHEVGSYGFR